MKRLLLAVSLLVAPCSHPQAADAPGPWRADHTTGTVGFSGTHAGETFRGIFTQRENTIILDPAAPANGRISARFVLSSARTGNAMYDGTLPQADWFNVKAHPDGTFVSSSLNENADGTYTVSGVLTLRGIAQPIRFPLSITPADDGSLQVKGEFSIDRLAYGIGAGSDPTSEWVGRNIGVQLDLTAR